MTPTMQILIGVRALLSEPKRWMKGGLAQDADGEDVEPFSQRAQCWCLVGAMIKVTNEALGLPGVDGYDLHEFTAYIRAQDLMKRVVGDGAGTIVSFNDAPETNHIDIQQAITFAIDIAREEGA